jgi:hypothetical protein
MKLGFECGVQNESFRSGLNALSESKQLFVLMGRSQTVDMDSQGAMERSLPPVSHPQNGMGRSGGARQAAVVVLALRA